MVLLSAQDVQLGAAGAIAQASAPAHGIWAVDAIVEVPHNGCPFQKGAANDRAGTVQRIAREWGEVPGG